MSRTVRAGNYQQLFKSDGTPATLTGERGFYTLSSATTYYVEIGAHSAAYQSAHLQWDAALVGAITVEVSDAAPSEAPLISTETGDWLQVNPSTAYVPIAGTGASVLALTITLAGGGVGGAAINLAELAHSRVRIRVAVTTGGSLRCAQSGKA